MESLREKYKSRIGTEGAMTSNRIKAFQRVFQVSLIPKLAFIISRLSAPGLASHLIRDE